jgi:NADH-quinone oxidoreductase subunit E
VAFSPGDRHRAEQIAERYPHSKSATLPLLHLVQERDGWVTKRGIEDVAEFLGLTPALVLGTCSFYTMFKRKPCGRLVVSVCTNVTCLVTGGPGVLEHLEARYGDDPDVLVEEVECLAACGGAPAMQVNYEYHERVTPDAAEQLVDEYRTGERAARTVSGSRAGDTA